MLYFTHSWSSHPWTNWYAILYECPPRCNHLCQIMCRSVKGLICDSTPNKCRFLYFFERPLQQSAERDSVDVSPVYTADKTWQSCRRCKLGVTVTVIPWQWCETWCCQENTVSSRIHQLQLYSSWAMFSVNTAHTGRCHIEFVWATC